MKFKGKRMKIIEVVSENELEIFVKLNEERNINEMLIKLFIYLVDKVEVIQRIMNGEGV